MVFLPIIFCRQSEKANSTEAKQQHWTLKEQMHDIQIPITVPNDLVAFHYLSTSQSGTSSNERPVLGTNRS